MKLEKRKNEIPAQELQAFANMKQDTALLEAVILSGIIARGGWSLEMFDVRNVLEKKVRPIVREILCKTN